jgi:hypothetical protein
MAAIRPVLVDKQSPFLGEACALCKQPFAPGEELAICPEDATRHHTHCWRANGNKCTAYGCTGRGQLLDVEPSPPPPPRRPRSRVVTAADSPAESDSPRSKVRTMPASSFSCAQSCLIIAIAVSILLFAVGCFGLWAIADYIALEILHWPYRGPLPGASSHLLPILAYLVW